jgi:hypothetical protein
MIFALSFLLTCALVITLAFVFQPTEKRPESEASDSNSAIQVKPETTPIPPSSPAIRDKADPEKQPRTDIPDRPRRVIQG